MHQAVILNLIDFQVRKELSTKLEWISASDITGNCFEIQSSLNGTHWQTIARVENGESNPSAVYNFIDIHFSETRFYYRLHQINDDGKSIFLPVAAVSIEADLDVVPAFINRGDLVKVINTTGEPVSVIFLDRDGRQLKQLDAGTEVTELAGKALPPGMYLLRISTIAGSVQKHVFIH